ncbi:Syntaxin-binding protein 2 [Wickerhamomyces ciferrii]|uniref:Syntaxin-binding protein 2 n=1 Tax=Wickerhamomyces ciferrii (strain ATCC 14091 / BCRC 22168 / CBS 111 / JCM 3599 / NBRC 0793 / NRRL Y-1031 F-60-10) TaxID=1206466 RepID=K0KMV4_WICCF|nr:Syntaxin-binding protein 2 [Wickerhamomyces ciferrii]CCH46610.1 Syntaxin-binding protein 2 [Wickerhamomyces ciferrii]
MDLFEVSDFYLNRIVSANAGKNGGKKELSVLPGSRIKVLLLDQSTVPIISLNSTQSELLQHEIYLINRIDNFNRDKMRHLKCICFLEPTEESINNLLEELRNPKYSSYELFFNNTLTKTQLERLAESDDLEVVTKVEEIFLDYLTINKDLYSLNLKQRIYGDSINSWNGIAFNKSVQGLTSLLLSLKARPIIRYEANSKMAAKLSKELIYGIEKTNSSLFDFKLKDSPPQLLILDRKNDPITPLLVPWTYQSMVHELIGIENNTVDLSNSPGITEDLAKIVLSARQDPFYDESMFLNFGDLSDKIKDYVSNYKDKTKTSRKLDTVDDMKRFIEEFPEFKKLSGNVSKHMSLVSELDRKINQLRLWEVSELEQNLSSHDQHNSDLQEIDKLLSNKPDQPGKPSGPPISEDTKVRLVALYALRYETNSNNQIQRLKEILKKQGVPLYKIAIIDYLIRSSGVSQRLDDEQSIFDKATSNLISGFKTNHQTNNIYMQHVPRLESILSKAVRGKLSERNYPILSPYQGIYNNLNQERAQDLIVFIIGGTTFEEARIVSELNSINKNVRIILGGTSIHNTQSFIDEVEDAGSRWPKTTAGERLNSRVN